MEISSAAIGATRLGLQVISLSKLPSLEFYYTFYNRLGPPDLRMIQTDDGSIPVGTHGHRFSDIFLQFSIANIKGQRAENILLTGESNLTQIGKKLNFGGLFVTPFKQMPPGQVHHLFRIDIADLWADDDMGKMSGMRSDKIELTAEYDLPSGLVNGVKSCFLKQGNGRSLRTKFEFSPIMIDGWLPPVDVQ